MPNKSIQQFDQELEEKNLQGLWNEALWKSDAKLMTKDPKTMVLPCVWKGEDIYGYLTQAGDLVGFGREGRATNDPVAEPGPQGLQRAKACDHPHDAHVGTAFKAGGACQQPPAQFRRFSVCGQRPWSLHGSGRGEVCNGARRLILNPPMCCTATATTPNPSSGSTDWITR